jgi:hypothetical protein
MQHFAPARLAGSSCATLDVHVPTIECFRTDKTTVATADLPEQREARRFTTIRLQPFCNESSRSLGNFRLNKAQRVPFVNSLCQGSNANVSRTNTYLLSQYKIG